MGKSYIAALIALGIFASGNVYGRGAGEISREELDWERFEEINQPITNEDLTQKVEFGLFLDEDMTKIRARLRDRSRGSSPSCENYFATYANGVCVMAKLNKRTCIELNCDCRQRTVANILNDTLACLQAPEPEPKPANSGTDCNAEFTLVYSGGLIITPGPTYFVIATNRALCPSTRWIEDRRVSKRLGDRLDVVNPDGAPCIYNLTPEMKAFADNCARTLLGIPSQKGTVLDFLDARAAEVKNFVGTKKRK